MTEHTMPASATTTPPQRRSSHRHWWVVASLLFTVVALYAVHQTWYSMNLTEATTLTDTAGAAASVTVEASATPKELVAARPVAAPDRLGATRPATSPPAVAGYPLFAALFAAAGLLGAFGAARSLVATFVAAAMYMAGTALLGGFIRSAETVAGRPAQGLLRHGSVQVYELAVTMSAVLLVVPAVLLAWERIRTHAARVASSEDPQPSLLAELAGVITGRGALATSPKTEPAKASQ